MWRARRTCPKRWRPRARCGRAAGAPRLAGDGCAASRPCAREPRQAARCHARLPPLAPGLRACLLRLRRRPPPPTGRPDAQADCAADRPRVHPEIGGQPAEHGALRLSLAAVRLPRRPVVAAARRAARLGLLFLNCPLSLPAKHSAGGCSAGERGYPPRFGTTPFPPVACPPQVLDTPEFFWSAPDSMQNLYKRVCEVGGGGRAAGG